MKITEKNYPLYYVGAAVAGALVSTAIYQTCLKPDPEKHKIHLEQIEQAKNQVMLDAPEKFDVFQKELSTLDAEHKKLKTIMPFDTLNFWRTKHESLVDSTRIASDAFEKGKAAVLNSLKKVK